MLRPAGHVVVVASIGSATPFYTPESVLARGFRRRGIERVDSGEVAAGTYFVGRMRESLI